MLDCLLDAPDCRQPHSETQNTIVAGHFTDLPLNGGGGDTTLVHFTDLTKFWNGAEGQVTDLPFNAGDDDTTSQQAICLSKFSQAASAPEIVNTLIEILQAVRNNSEQGKNHFKLIN